MQSAGRVAFPSGGPRGESVSCLSSFWRLPTRLGSQPLPPSSKPAMQRLAGPACHRPLWPQPGKFLHVQGCMDPMEGCDPWVIRDHLPISGSSILVTSAKGLLPCKVTYSQIPGIKAGTSLGVCYPAYCALCPHFQYDWRTIPSEPKKSEKPITTCL